MPVLAGEMAVHGETLLVEDQFHPRIAERRDRAHGLGIDGEDGGRGGDDSDEHDLKLPQDPFASSEGELPPALRRTAGYPDVARHARNSQMVRVSKYGRAT